MVTQLEAHAREIQVEVVSLTPATAPGRVLGLARVQITSRELTLTCGPWRILERQGTAPAVLPPDVRQDGRWVDTVTLPAPVLQLVEEAVLTALRDYEGVTAQ